MPSIVTTLYEGEYHLGVGALANSLARIGFDGEVHIGHRGDLPPWTAGLRQLESGRYAAGSLTLIFVPMRDLRHLAVQKPEFLLSILEERPDCDRIFYIDPDITVRGRWAFFQEWSDFGIGLCQDISDAYMANDHPIRQRWTKWAAAKGLECKRPLDRYFNSGFVSVRREDRGFLDLWARVLHEVAQDGHTADKLVRNRSYPFATWDQDAMNIALMACTEPMSTLGPEGMDFANGGYTMAHSVGRPKPWNKRFLVRALGGIHTTSADKGWVANTESPIRVLSPSSLMLKKLDLKLGAFVSRFVTRR